MASDPLSSEETRRYARHLVLKGMGGAGQQKLKAARVVVIGAGGLGSPAIAALAASGIGRLGILDPDIVSLSNLQRQILHGTADIGRTKVESAGDFVAALNPHVALDLHATRIDAGNAEALLGGYNLVLDGTDNLATRRIVAAAAEKLRLPLVSGAVGMFSGQVTIFAPHLGGPGHDAVFPAAADDALLPSCEANGILGPVTGIIGALMAMEAIKLIAGIGTPLIGRLLLYDGQEGQFSELQY